MFERRDEPVASKWIFLRRMSRSFVASLGVVGLSLGIGSLGYRVFGGLPWIDALMNASMILTGMGPVSPMQTNGGKLFATFYALYSGIAFLTMAAIMVAPMMHRLLHLFHLDEGDSDEKVEARSSSDVE